MKSIAIIGAGGNAREIGVIAKDLGYDVLGYLGDTCGAYDSDKLGDFTWLEHNHVDCLAMGIASPELKLYFGMALKKAHPEIEWPVLIAKSAYIGPECVFGAGAIICVRAIASINVQLGAFTQLNFGCTIGHDASIGDGSLINPGANISGGVNIGICVEVGTGAQVLQYLRIGDGATVGAGAVVTKDVDAHTTVIGIPAKPLDRK